jgi:hypothetical protein
VIGECVPGYHSDDSHTNYVHNYRYSELIL